MLYKILKKDDYNDFVKKLISDYIFIGPVKKNKAVHDFVPIKDFARLDLNYKRTTIPPAKKILFTPVETLIQYEIGEDIKVKPNIEAREMILFGIDACDLNGMNFLDRFFSTDFIDENYFSKRRNLIVIGVDRMPSETCFALSMGKEYVKDGFDLFLTDLKDRYFVRVGTEKGKEILEKYARTGEAVKKDFSDYNKFLDNYRSKFKQKVDINNFYDNYEPIYDDKEFWNKVAKDCYSCGSCCLVCPTCFCFNVKDEMELNLTNGSRVREWDSCMIPEYGLCAGGHNFRPDKENRLKQRYRCKLKTYVDKFGTYSCVGCGRCIEACMAKINIADDINSVKKEVSV
ncbi:MAG: 4Fe-4S dicluster domain-containing protein [Actinobacteria bacterium]|nr:4Fe-4S dicluster domain-containing protein [Actinomycetota bacterium]